MKLVPVLTEKSLEMAKGGRYTFFVDPSLTKFQIKKMVEDIFGVSVIGVRTMNMKKRVTRDVRRRKKVISAKKKAVVTLKEGDKIKVFEVK